VLEAVLAQQAPWPFEVIVVDSGSSDGSVELARRYGVRVEVIAPAEFGHGRTRNQLASMAAGEFLVFITQDARPASPQWLANMVRGCDAGPDVAGAFGPHRAHPEARHVTHCELNQHFAGFGSALAVVRLDDPARFATDTGYRQWLHFFSSNNACIRRSVWQTLPLPEVAFAEDQTWALRAIEAGYAKAFVPDAVVYHSHDFGVWETLQRNFDEAGSFLQDHLGVVRVRIHRLERPARHQHRARSAGSTGAKRALKTCRRRFAQAQCLRIGLTTGNEFLAQAVQGGGRRVHLLLALRQLFAH
jgi:rhamnosyltransferase